MSWCIFIGSCFGVVLEGPMGAVVYWTVTGIAYALTCQMIEERKTMPSAQTGAADHYVKIAKNTTATIKQLA